MVLLLHRVPMGRPELGRRQALNRKSMGGEEMLNVLRNLSDSWQCQTVQVAHAGDMPLGMHCGWQCHGDERSSKQWEIHAVAVY